MDALSLAEAATIAGVPAVQLRRWAWEDWDVYGRNPSGQVGPRNIGTRNKPLYLEQDVREWRGKYQGESRDGKPATERTDSGRKALAALG